MRRAGWIGPVAPGRVDFVSRERGRELAEELHERIRPTSVGEVGMPGGHLDGFFGTRPDAENPELLRVVQYRAPGGGIVHSDECAATGPALGAAVQSWRH